ncbi:aldehyde dehydrogenase family 3 member F1-like [Mercurialis annua]|uniref:aldehyde dehydrogenase family 3 member F1-like n=1 Tax=Mercurialis annua TaxID=3986 RepID=UPI00215ECB7A|nr:aldehyde dehydrogenase family 3 member F1-like [Mercurialis annua]
MEKVEENLREVRETFRSGKTKSIAWRKSQLKALINLITENEAAMFDVLYQDLGKHPAESYRDEIGVVSKSAKYALSCIDKWVAPKKGHVPLLLFPASAQVIPEPFGVVLVFGSWNFPFSLGLDPLIGAISAGNCVILKAAELSPKCSSFLAQTIPKYLDSEAVKVIEGGIDVSEKILQQKWDKIFFTGSQHVGRIVMTAAAKHLTPVVLELGGKSPTIIDGDSVSSDMKVVAKRIVGGKWGPCCGQACISVDYLLVDEKSSAYLIDSLKRIVKKFYGENPKESTSISKIVNKRNFDRLCNLLKDPLVEASIVHGGSIDEESMSIEPTILLNPPLDSEIMTEEIFGPLLPVITVKNIQESIEIINSKPKPLVIYAFTKDESFKQQLVTQTSSGGLVFNDTMIQFVCDDLPFGGVGNSGFGRYHGKYSFDTFSHEKAVLQRSFLIEIEPRYPPWTDFKVEFIRTAYRFDYFKLILLLLGLKK